MQAVNETLPTAAVLLLVARNHPGVMTQVCGLCCRRGYDLVGLVCLPAATDSERCIWLKVAETTRLEQIVRQLAKLHDVRSVALHSADHEVFARFDQAGGTGG